MARRRRRRRSRGGLGVNKEVSEPHWASDIANTPHRILPPQYFTAINNTMLYNPTVSTPRPRSTHKIFDFSHQQRYPRLHRYDQNGCRYFLSWVMTSNSETYSTK